MTAHASPHVSRVAALVRHGRNPGRAARLHPGSRLGLRGRAPFPSIL